MTGLRVTANGEPYEVAAGTSVEAFIVGRGLDPRFVLVEWNGEPLERWSYETATLSEGDRLELVRAVAGGSGPARSTPGAGHPGGETVLAGSRGRTTWPPAGQVAELAVREEVGELGLDALTVTRADDAWLVRHLDGRACRVTVTVEDTGVIRRESCLKDAVPMPAFRARISEPTGQT